MTNFVYHNDLPDGLEFKDSIAIDSETMGLNIFRDRLCVIQISDGNGDAHLVNFDEVTRNGGYVAPNLKKLLADNRVQKIFHYARFDIAVIKFYLNIDIQNIYCTKIASKLCRTYTDAHGLKSLCQELLGVELSKKQQSYDWGSDTLTKKQIDYAASDVLYLHQLRDILTKMLQREDRYNIFLSCLDFLPSRVELDIRNFSSGDIFAH